MRAEAVEAVGCEAEAVGCEAEAVGCEAEAVGCRPVQAMNRAIATYWQVAAAHTKAWKTS